jgi:hypothetical protein
VAFFLEYDRGTESLGRVEDKMRDYQKLFEVIDPRHVVAFVFESAARELSARLALNRFPRVPVATMTLYPDTSPHGGEWWQRGRHNRLRLEDLAGNEPE